MKGLGPRIPKSGEPCGLAAFLRKLVDIDMRSWYGRPRERRCPYISWWRDFDPATWEVCGPFHFCLYHGRDWYWQPHPAWCSLGKLGRCGQNSIRLCLERPELTYVEGVAWTLKGLIQHSWVVDRNGRIIDPTWGDKEDHHPYFGVPFKTAYVRQVCAKGIRGSIVCNWHEG